MSALLALCVFALQDPKPAREPLVPAPNAQAEAAAPAEGALPQDTRRSPVSENPPFDRDRPLLRISLPGAAAAADADADAEGTGTGTNAAGRQTVSAAELNELVAYFRSWRGGGEASLLRAAVDALLPSKVVEATYGAELPGMHERMAEALEQLKEGRDFAEVVAEFSDDTEAPTPDARYTFIRGVSVQPFDRHAHSAATGELVGPFLTKYGLHVLQVLGYERDEQEPRKDATTVRHILVMYPSLKELDEADQDIRAHIKALIAGAQLEALEAGMENLLPPSHRD